MECGSARPAMQPATGFAAFSCPPVGALREPACSHDRPGARWQDARCSTAGGEIPELTIVIDHMADCPVNQPRQLDKLIDLQRYPKVFVKISHTWSLSKQP